MPINRHRWTKAGGGSGGSGNVTGPGSSTDNAVVRWDGAGGTTIQNSVVIASDAGAVSGITQLDVDNIRTDGNTISSTDANGNIVLDPNGTGIVSVSADRLAFTGEASLRGTGGLIQVRDEGNTAYRDIYALSFQGWTNAGVRVAMVSPGDLAVSVGSNAKFDWSSTTDASGTRDLGIARNAVGVAKVTDGSSGSGWWMGDAGKTRLAADHTVATNSTTLAAINNLTTTVAASRHYKFRAMLHFTTVNTSGVKVAVSGTATHTNIIYDVTIFGISTPAFLTSGRATAKDTAVGVTASGTACYALIEGFTTINAAGTLLLQAAQNAETGAAESVIALRGSSFEVTDFA